MKDLKCPSCHGKLGVKFKPKLGQRLKCRGCSSLLEVVDLDPVEFDSFYDEEDQADNRSRQSYSKGNLSYDPLATDRW